MGEHAGKIHLLDSIITQQIPKKIALWYRVKAVCIQVETLFRMSSGFLCGNDKRWLRIHLVVSSLRYFDKINNLFLHTLILYNFEEFSEEPRDDPVIEKFVKLVYTGQNHIHTLSSAGQDLLNLQTRSGQVTG